MPDPIDVAVGQRIRDRRRVASMSQDALGRAIGVTFQQVQKYERGSNRISASMMARAAEALACSVADLMGEAPGDELSAGAREMANIFERLQSDEERRALLNLARSMMKRG
jgi:transcriptional regulator with XRE-family HTH domain